MWVSHYPLIPEVLRPFGIHTSVPNLHLCCLYLSSEILQNFHLYKSNSLDHLRVFSMLNSCPKWEKLFLHSQPITTWLFPHIGWVDQLQGWRLGLYYLKLFSVCFLKNEETDFLFSFSRHKISHNCNQIHWGSILESRALSANYNCFWVKWSNTVVQAQHCNHALHPVISISSYIQKLHSKRSASLHNLTAEIFTLLIVQANTTPPLYLVIKRGVVWSRDRQCIIWTT